MTFESNAPTKSPLPLNMSPQNMLNVCLTLRLPVERLTSNLSSRLVHLSTQNCIVGAWAAAFSKYKFHYKFTISDSTRTISAHSCFCFCSCFCSDGTLRYPMPASLASLRWSSIAPMEPVDAACW